MTNRLLQDVVALKNEYLDKQIKLQGLLSKQDWPEPVLSEILGQLHEVGHFVVDLSHVIESSYRHTLLEDKGD